MPLQKQNKGHLRHFFLAAVQLLQGVMEDEAAVTEMEKGQLLPDFFNNAVVVYSSSSNNSSLDCCPQNSGNCSINLRVLFVKSIRTKVFQVASLSGVLLS